MIGSAFSLKKKKHVDKWTCCVKLAVDSWRYRAGTVTCECHKSYFRFLFYIIQKIYRDILQINTEYILIMFTHFTLEPFNVFLITVFRLSINVYSAC